MGCMGSATTPAGSKPAGTESVSSTEKGKGAAEGTVDSVEAIVRKQEKKRKKSTKDNMTAVLNTSCILYHGFWGEPNTSAVTI